MAGQNLTQPFSRQNGGFSMATLADFDEIPVRVARELGLFSDCMLYRSDGKIEWACHIRLAVRFAFREV